MNGFEPGSSGVGVDHSANFTPFGVLFEEFCVSTPPPIVCSQILTLVNCFWCFNFEIDIFYVYSDFLSGIWLLLRYRLILLRYIRISLQFQSFLRWHWCSFTSTLSFLRQPQRFSYLDLDFFLPRFRLFLT